MNRINLHLCTLSSRAWICVQIAQNRPFYDMANAVLPELRGFLNPPTGNSMMPVLKYDMDINFAKPKFADSTGRI